MSFYGEDIYDLLRYKVEKDYLKNHEDEITNIVEEIKANNRFDSSIFSEETIKYIKKYMVFYGEEGYDFLRHMVEKTYLQINEDKIINIIEEYEKNDRFDSDSFSEEIIEKNRLLKEFEPIYKDLCLMYDNIQTDQQELE